MGKSLYIYGLFIINKCLKQYALYFKTIKAKMRKQAKNRLLFDQPSGVIMILIKRWQLVFTLFASFLAFSCVNDVTPNRNHETGQETDQKDVSPMGATECTDDLYRQWYANGVLAEETMFAHGKKNGVHRLWYENGKRKLTSRFVEDRLDGTCLAWYENGKSRLNIQFDQGKRTGEWIRTGEKVGVVARIFFKDNRLNGPLTVLVNRGYGNGSGRSLEIEAKFYQGQLVSSFRFKEADPSGNNLHLTGTILTDGQLQVHEIKNMAFHPNGTLTGRMGDVETSYSDINHFFSSKITNRVMPMFTLEFCGIQIEMTL